MSIEPSTLEQSIEGVLQRMFPDTPGLDDAPRAGEEGEPRPPVTPATPPMGPPGTPGPPPVEPNTDDPGKVPPPRDDPSHTYAPTDPQQVPSQPSGVPPDPPVPTPPPDAADYLTIGDQRYSPDQVRQALEVQQWFSGLSQFRPDALQALDSYLNGQAPQASPTPTPSRQGDIPAPERIDPLDDEMVPEAVRDVLRRQESDIARLTAEQQQNHMRNLEASVQQGRDDFASRYTLSAQDMTVVEAALVSSGLFPNLVRTHNNDPRAAAAAGMEFVYWNMPQFREQAIAAAAQQRMDALHAQATQDTDRQRRLGSLSGGGAPAPRNETPALDTPQARDTALRAELAALMSGQSA